MPVGHLGCRTIGRRRKFCSPVVEVCPSRDARGWGAQGLNFQTSLQSCGSGVKRTATLMFSRKMFESVIPEARRDFAGKAPTPSRRRWETLRSWCGWTATRGVARFEIADDSVLAAGAVGALAGAAIGAATGAGGRSSDVPTNAFFGVLIGGLLGAAAGAAARPNRVVTLVFDDSSRSWRLYTGPYAQWAKEAMRRESI